jgi:membrane associated rhomboid family serine protease
MARLDRALDRFTFGGRLPGGVGLLVVITAVASLATAFTSRHGAPLFDLAALAPALVWRGEVWRLGTWAFIEPDPIYLLFACVMLVWFGRDLENEWGARRLLGRWLGVVALASVVTCLVALVDPDVAAQRYLGALAISEAMVVAWGLWFPERVILLFFILPLRGIWIAWITVAVAFVFAVYEGWAGHLPALVAIAATLAWFYLPAIAGRRWKAKREAAARAKKEARSRAARAKKRAASAAHLRVIEADDDDPPPLPPELEGQIGRLLGDPKRRRDRDDDDDDDDE